MSFQLLRAFSILEGIHFVLKNQDGSSAQIENEVYYFLAHDSMLSLEPIEL
jgi:hypothetical protein